MSLSDTVSGIIDKYGVTVTITPITSSENERGQLIDVTGADYTEIAIQSEPTSYTSLFKLVGIENIADGSFLFKSSANVSKNYLLTLNGNTYKITKLQEINYKGNIVLKIAFVSEALE